MDRPEYLSNYLFDWELFDVIVGGKSALDSKFFINSMKNVEEVNNFLLGYGVNPDDPVSGAELFGNFQESIQFVKRYFLKEGNSQDGLDFKIPNSLFMISDVRELFLMATGNTEHSEEERLWAELILKIMHTILHVDKDLRSSYFSTIQTQILDRFYKYIYRDQDDNLFLGIKGEQYNIPLVDFEAKSKKTRDSVIIKLLHKAENVAEELFDRIGIRIVTRNKFDTLRVINFLLKKNVIVPHNIKPSRSVNSLVDLDDFRVGYNKIIKESIRKKLTEEEFHVEMDKVACDLINKKNDRNDHSAKNYKSIQFTCRHLIKYKNPFFKEFSKIRKEAKGNEEEYPLAKKILSMDMSLIARDVKFFYPYEVQVVDELSHKGNTEGDASHQEYKRQQLISAMNRVFWALKKKKGVS